MLSLPRASWRVLLAAVAGALVLLGLSAPQADAHAVLVSSSPGDGARLDSMPAEVRLEFNEPVNADLGGLRVFDGDGARVDRGAVRVEGVTVAVALGDGLGDGVYVATYRVVSADGHPIRGGLVFSVGDADSETVGLDRFFASDDDRGWEVAGAVGRWLAMAGTLVAAGGGVFLVWCQPDAGRGSRRVVRLAGAVGATGLLIAVPVQAALGTGQGAGALFQRGVLRTVLNGDLGWSTGIGVVGLAGVVIGLGRSRVLVLVGALAAAAAFALVGHTRADDVVVGTVADVVHVSAAAVWAGGLVLLVLALGSGIPADRRVDVVGRFSNTATASIVAVGLAGLTLAITEVKGIEALTSTAYGWTLVAKVGLVALVAAAGAYNHFRLVPAVRTDPDGVAGWRSLVRSLRVEMAGIAIALALTAVLVNLVPAGVAAGIGQIHSEILPLGDAGSVQIVVDPNRAGENTVHLYFYDPDGRPAELAEEVRLDFSKPSDDIGPIGRTPFRAGPAHFQLDGSELVSGGRWEITVIARLSRFAQASATTDVLVSG